MPFFHLALQLHINNTKLNSRSPPIDELGEGSSWWSHAQFKQSTEVSMATHRGAATRHSIDHRIHKWLPIYYSFVCMLIILKGLVLE